MQHPTLEQIREWDVNQYFDSASDGAEVYCLGFFRLFPEGATPDQIKMLKLAARRYYNAKSSPQAKKLTL